MAVLPVGLLVLTFLVNVSHQWNLGPCPSKHYVQSFRFYRWDGVWYEQARKETPVWESYSSCNRFHFRNNTQGSFSMVVPVTQKAVDIPLEIESVSGVEREANFMWNFKFPLITAKRQVFILSTNYLDWALVWSCQNYFVLNYQTTWILTREVTPSQSWVQRAIEQALDLADLRFEDFSKVRHDNCTYPDN